MSNCAQFIDRLIEESEELLSDHSDVEKLDLIKASIIELKAIKAMHLEELEPDTKERS